MSIEFQEARERFEKSLRDRLGLDGVEQIQQEEVDEIAQELEDELDSTLSADDGEQGAAYTASFHQPPPDEVMSRDESGAVLSRFGDAAWHLVTQSGLKRGYHFTAHRGENDAYRDDALAVPLVYLEKQMLYAFWPGKNLTQRPYTPASLTFMHRAIRTLLSWFHERGYFLGDSLEDLDHGSELITDDEIRAEITRRMSDDILISHLQEFMTGVRLWQRFGVTGWCPAWFCPSFTFRAVFTKPLVKAAAKTLAAKRNRWAAIEFDSLQPLFSTAQSYLELFHEDIFWLIGQFELASELAFKSSHDEDTLRETITSTGRTKELFDAICERSYAIDPRSGEPWFVPDISVKDSNTKIVNLSNITTHLRTMVGAASFVLFSFTGMRHWEMKAMKTGALSIDGEPLDEDGDIFAQVEAGRTFDLRRTVFKMKTSPIGEQHVTPIPKMAAKAYAVLLRAFSYSRAFHTTKADVGEEGIVSDSLFPPNGLKFKWQASGYGFRSENPHMTDISRFLKKFCEAAGVDYFFPHQCRKTLATLLINDDQESLEIIKWLLGHSTLMMTYAYIMSLPGLREEVWQYLKELGLKNIVKFVGDTLEGHVAGAAGNRALDAVIENLESWKGEKLDRTVATLLKSYEESNFTLVRTPAAWCVRFPTRVPQTAPCLPPAMQESIQNGEPVDVVVPRFEHCIPWECGDAGHTRDDLPTARRSQKYANKMAASSSGQTRARYQKQAEYWAEVAAQLENGRQDVVGENLFALWASGGTERGV